MTYGDIDAVAPRLVGWVLATIDADLPWHRVVRSDGSVAMGAHQLDLLRAEGVPVRRGRVDLRVARTRRTTVKPAAPAATRRSSHG